MKATYLEHMGTDKSIVAAARVSFGKFKEGFDDADKKLLNFLARNSHESPFAHTAVKFHFEAPIFVARQLAKSQIGFSWNEVSRRYVKSEPRFWVPNEWRKAAENVKQGSNAESIKELSEPFGEHKKVDISFNYYYVALMCKDLYEQMLKDGVCPEQARSVLPQSMITEWHWTGSLLGWARVWHLRTKPDAQKETRDLVLQIDEPLTKLFPEAWSVLKRWRPIVQECVEA